MLPTTISRVAVTQRASSTVILSNAVPTASAATGLATQCLARQGTSHQRRHSSSKAASPPNNDKPAPAAKASAAQNPSQTPAADARTRGKKASRYNRLVPTPVSRSKSDQFAGLPAVPGVQHLHEKDFGLCSFFSLHRPLSLTATIPPPTSQEQFNGIFESRSASDAWENGNSAERRPEDVIYTLHNTIDALENGAGDAQEDAVRWEVVQDSQSHGSNVKHLDGSPRMKTLKELVDQFRPFNAPPPPEAFAQESKPEERKKASKASRPNLRQKRYTATIMVTESTDAQGQRTFTASSSPIVRVPDVEDEVRPTSMREPTARRQIRQPFLERMRKRGQISMRLRGEQASDKAGERPVIRQAPSHRREKMFLISVKRQRKLKMKKHKYKKLMKRTRTLRRRLDRA